MSWKIKSGLKELQATEQIWGPDGRAGGQRFVLAFANTYHLAMSNLGFQTVYGLLADRTGVHVDRAFLPPPQVLAEHRRTQTPWLTLAEQRPVSQAEVVAFSLPFENDYLNLLTLLDLAGLACRAEERRPTDPLIVVGGVAPSLNPEPLAPFVDLIFIGEAEAILPDFLDLYLECEKGDREDFIYRAARKIEGLYAPRFYRPVYDAKDRLMGIEPTIAGLPGRVKRRAAVSLEAPAASRIIASATEFGDRFLVELSRGCGHGCRFCAAGHVLRPPRQVAHDRLLSAIKQGAGRLKRVGLVSAAVSDTPGIEELCLAAVQEGAEVSVSSLRADTFTPTLARLLVQGGAKTVTFAPEAGSQRLREAINKGLSEADILQACLLAVEAGIVNLRLYFIIGLPGETDEDVLGVADLTKKVLHHLCTATAGQRRLRRLTLSVASFVAKPQTPFQWAAMTPLKELKRSGQLIRRALAGQKPVRLTFDAPKWAHVEGLISRGDRRVGELLAEVKAGGGDWNKALARANLNPDFYTTRERDADEFFPWEVVDSGISRDYLWSEYQFALRGRPSPGCFEGCDRCGVCESGFRSF